MYYYWNILGDRGIKFFKYKSLIQIFHCVYLIEHNFGVAEWLTK